MRERQNGVSSARHAARRLCAAPSSVEIKQLVEQVDQIRTLTLPPRIADFFLRQVSDTSGPALYAALQQGAQRQPARRQAGSFSRSLVLLRDQGVQVDRDVVRRLVFSFHDDPSCETAKCSPSGGLMIPAIKSRQCAICRAGALRV